MPTIIVTQANGTIHELDAKDGLSAMEVIRDAALSPMGECNGSLSCATCHVSVEPEWSDKIPEITEKEEDILDTVFNLTATSRLSCQIKVHEGLNGLKLSIPE